jgi:hypothetical protein
LLYLSDKNKRDEERKKTRLFQISYCSFFFQDHGKATITDAVSSAFLNDINNKMINVGTKATFGTSSVSKKHNQHHDINVNSGESNYCYKRASLDYDSNTTDGISSIPGGSTRGTWISSLSFSSGNSSHHNQVLMPPKLWQKRKDIYQTYITGLLSMMRGTFFSLLSMILSMIIQLYPSCPRFGTALAFMSLFLYTDEVSTSLGGPAHLKNWVLYK